MRVGQPPPRDKIELVGTMVDLRQEEIDKALAGIRELRKRTGRITLTELLSARDEGRKCWTPVFEAQPPRKA